MQQGGIEPQNYKAQDPSGRTLLRNKSRSDFLRRLPSVELDLDLGPVHVGPDAGTATDKRTDDGADATTDDAGPDNGPDDGTDAGADEGSDASPDFTHGPVVPGSVWIVHVPQRVRVQPGLPEQISRRSE